MRNAAFKSLSSYILLSYSLGCNLNLITIMFRGLVSCFCCDMDYIKMSELIPLSNGVKSNRVESNRIQEEINYKKLVSVVDNIYTLIRDYSNNTDRSIEMSIQTIYGDKQHDKTMQPTTYVVCLCVWRVRCVKRRVK